MLTPEAAARITAGLAADTSKANARHWATFTRWCEPTGRTALPTTRETLVEYVHHLTRVLEGIARRGCIPVSPRPSR